MRKSVILFAVLVNAGLAILNCIVLRHNLVDAAALRAEVAALPEHRCGKVIWPGETCRAVLLFDVPHTDRGL